MSNDITFCVNKNCPRACHRKRYQGLEHISMSDFGKDYKGEQIDYKKCEYYWEIENKTKGEL